MPGLIFLIFFPFLMAVLTYYTRDEKKRTSLVIGGSIVIMAVDIAFVASCYLKGTGDVPLTFVYRAGVADVFIMLCEIFLVGVVSYLSVKYKKYYCILISLIGTLPVLILDIAKMFSGGGQEAAHILIDNITLIMCVIVGVVGGIICIYATGYLHDYHEHHTDVGNRSSYFQALLFVFLGAMFGLITSDNLSWIFFFWEITSVTSFLLIGYPRSEESVTNSFRALWMNLLGGCGFTFSILFCHYMYESENLSELLDMGSDMPGIIIPVVLLSFAALTKSAQMPFSRWLLGAMVAPTPSSALLHSATMVKAGVYLLIRLSPLMDGNLCGVMITTIGGFTFFASSLLAISVSDGKKVLAYSTISNLGLITACAGVGHPEAVWAAVMLLVFHAVSKSLMFLAVGAVENSTGSRDIEDMHGLVIKLPKLAFVMIVGICGMFLAPFGMLVAKWAALKAYLDSNNILLVVFLVFGSATTLFYWGKWLGKLFAYMHQSERLRDNVHRTEWGAIYPLTGLVIALCILFPVVGRCLIQPELAIMFGEQIGAVINADDIRIMFMMLAMIAILPIMTWILSRRNREKMTMAYMAGVNAGDDRHYIDSFGSVRPLYLSNWYMDPIFGEGKILKPSLYVAAVFLGAIMILSIGGAL